ncbi:MAG: cobalamin biosynthesis protein CobQ [Alphaproteobacteria bacterium]|nr:cobalamin biosynthesis protein CobQ [Alphaproteobacteria bacterium]
MNTPTHLLIAAAAFSRPGAPARNNAVTAGALLPDAAIYVLFLGATFSGVPQETIWRELYFSAAFQGIDAILNSVFVYGAIALAGWGMGSSIALVFAGSALLHVAADFATHHSDAHAHFWPFWDWRFESPLSYWEASHHAAIVMPLEALIALICITVVWSRFSGRLFKAALGGLASLYVLGATAMIAASVR